MIDRILEQGPAIRRVLDDRNSQHLIPTWQDMEVLESVNAALKPVANFTDALSSEKVVSASSLKPVLQLITGDVLLSGDEDTRLTHNLKEKMTAVLTDKYRAPRIQQLLAKAAFIDPRYKDIDIDIGEDIGEEFKDELIQEMIQEMMDLHEEHHGDREGDGETGDATCTAPNPPKKMNLADMLQKRKDKTCIPVPKRIRVDTEVRRYLQEETLDTHSDPLVWWRSNHARYPLLSKVARKYMTICATTVPSERVFSAAGNTVTPFRAALKPEKVNMLVFLSTNMKSDAGK